MYESFPITKGFISSDCNSDTWNMQEDTKSAATWGKAHSPPSKMNLWRKFLRYTSVFHFMSVLCTAYHQIFVRRVLGSSTERLFWDVWKSWDSSWWNARATVRVSHGHANWEFSCGNAWLQLRDSLM